MAHDVAIVGAGFSGTACALAIRRAAPGARMCLIERSGRFGPGLAYGTRSGLHMLNVPAAALGIESAHPQGFTAWLESHRGSPAPYQARAYYGEYLSDAVEEAASTGPLTRVHAQVVRLERQGDGFLLHTTAGDTHAAAAVVLATGYPAATGSVEAGGDAADRTLPAWRDIRRIEALQPGSSVLCIGTGLTMIDMALTVLGERGARQLIALSRHGLLPHSHVTTAGAGALAAELVQELERGGANAYHMLRTFRRFQRVHAASLDWRDAITALRAHVPRLWRQLPDAERRRFLRHVRPWWDVHRHRCAPEVAARVESWLRAGRLRVIAGRLQSIEAKPPGLRVRYAARGSGERQELEVDLVIDATPASSDLSRTDDPLIRQLLQAGWLRPDSLRLGIEADDDGRPVGADGKPLTGFFYIGPWLRARDWEATAVAELRACASATAKAVVSDLAGR